MWKLYIVLFLFLGQFDFKECASRRRHRSHDNSIRRRGNWENENDPRKKNGFMSWLLRSPNHLGIGDEEVECRVIPNKQSENDDTLSFSLWELLDKSRKDLVLSNDQRSVVVLMGNTGSGKTTITQLVAGNASELEVVETQKGDIIIIDPDEKIGRTTASRTLVPELVVDPSSNLAIYDCPGFSDNRGANMDIAVNFLLKKVTDHVQSVKLVFTVIFSSVDGMNDKTDFDRLATSATRLLKNIEKMRDSIGLVVTKVPLVDARGKALSPEKVAGRVKSYLETYRDDQQKALNDIRPTVNKDIIQAKIRFVDALLHGEGSKIAVVQVPRDCGRMIDSPGVLETKDNLKQLMTNTLHFTPVTGSDFGYALTDAADVQIESSVLEISNNITAAALQVSKSIWKAQREKLEIHKDFTAYSNFLENEFITFTETIKMAQGLVDPAKVAETIQETLTSGGFEPSIGKRFQSEMFRLGEYLSFFIAMKPQSDIRQDKWLQPLQDYLNNDIGPIVDWAEFLVRLEKQVGSYEFQRNKPNIVVPPYPDLQFIEKILASDFVEKRIRDLLVSSNSTLLAEDMDYLRLILDRALGPITHFCTEGGSTLTVKGSYVKASDFVDEAGKYTKCPGANFANIFASKTFFVDRDIRPKKGKVHELVIFAPLWEVTTSGRSAIDLTGDTGIPPDPEKAPDGTVGQEPGQNGTVGQDGIPGKPGDSGGRFYGIAENFFNAEKLIIMASGGKGGDGQTGGNGAEGVKGRKVEYKEFPGCMGIWNLANLDKFFSYFDQAYDGSTIFETNVVKKGDSGGIGGNGGNGGAGGLGGFAGIVNVISIGANNNVPTNEAKDGNRGAGGRGGNGGYGGERGDGTSAVLWTASAPICGYNNIKEYKVTGERSRSGGWGRTGENSKGQKSPTRQQFSPSVSKIVNDYFAFLLSQEHEGLRNNFIQLLEEKKEELGLSNPASFSQELLSLESYALQLRHEKRLEISILILLPRYISFLQRVENYAKTNAGLSWERRKALSILYMTALSRTNSYKNTLGPTVVVNIEGYLETALQKFRRLKDTRTHVIVNEERQDYAKTFQSKVQQAMSFIQEKVGPGIDDIELEMAKVSNELLQQIGRMEAENVNKEAEAKIALQRAKEMAVFRHIFTALKIGSTVVSFMGPQGAAIGGIIGAATSIGESFALPQDTKLRPQIPLPSSIKRYADNMESKWKEKGDEESKTLDVVIDFAKKAIKENEDLGDVKKNVENLEADKKEFESKKRELPIRDFIAGKRKLMAQEKEIQTQMQEKLTNYEKAFESKETTEARKEQLKTRMKRIQLFKAAVTTAAELGLEVYNSYKNDEAKLEQLASMVEQAGDDLAKVRKYKDRVNSELLPMIEEVGGDIQEATAQMEGSSSVSLQVQKWGMKQKLTDFKFRLQDMTQGFASREKFGHIIDKLSEAVSMTIDLYDNIDKYNEQMRFADYIANVNSPDAMKIVIKDAEISRYISRIEMSLQSNILLGEYDRVVQTFKQWVFPFGNAYWNDYKLSDEIPAVLNPTKEEDPMTPEQISLFLIPKLEGEVENLSSRVKEYKNRYFPTVDVSVIDTNFNSEQRSTDPFFVWGPEKKNEIQDFLSGKPVTLLADAEYSYQRGRSAVKFNIAEFQPKTIDPDLQKELDDLLELFAVEMTHSGVSHYTYNDKSFVMVGDNVTLRYNFERNPKTGEREGLNEAYQKFRDGDHVLSPYTLWTVQLIKAKPRSTEGFEKLAKFAANARLELIGRGSYVDEKRFRTKMTPQTVMYFMQYQETVENLITLNLDQDTTLDNDGNETYIE